MNGNEDDTEKPWWEVPFEFSDFEEDPEDTLEASQNPPETTNQ